MLKRIRGITRLEVANRFTTAANRHYPNRKGQTFYGYGETPTCVLTNIIGELVLWSLKYTGTLQIRSHYACFYQVGADPIVSTNTVTMPLSHSGEAKVFC